MTPLERRIGAAWLALLTACSAPGALASQQEVGIEEVIRAALARHPSLAAARAVAKRADAAADEARAARLPTLSLEASATRFEQPMVVAPLHGVDPRHPPLFDRTLVQGGLAAADTLFDGGARAARIEWAEALASAAASGSEAARLALIAEAARAYLRVLATREIAAAHRGRVEAVEEERARVARFFREGRSARFGLLRGSCGVCSSRVRASPSCSPST